MPRSEIDDIFAAPKRPASSHPAPAPPASQEPEKKKKKSGKKRKREAEGKSTAPSDQPAEQPSKRKIPETILDPSLRLAGPPAKRSKPQAVEQPIAKKNSKVHREEEERFKDSRGTGPRRKTEEGFSVYKEDELGITDQGGDTPLCPFDCQCCF